MCLSAGMRLPRSYTFRKFLRLPQNWKLLWKLQVGKKVHNTLWRKHTAALCQLQVSRSYLVHLPMNFSLLEHRSNMENKWFWLDSSNVIGPTSCNRPQSITIDTRVEKRTGLFTGKWDTMLLCYAINCVCFATPFFSWKHYERPTGYNHLIIQACHIQGLQLIFWLTGKPKSYKTNITLKDEELRHQDIRLFIWDQMEAAVPWPDDFSTRISLPFSNSKHQRDRDSRGASSPTQGLNTEHWHSLSHTDPQVSTQGS